MNDTEITEQPMEDTLSPEKQLVDMSYYENNILSPLSRTGNSILSDTTMTEDERIDKYLANVIDNCIEDLEEEQNEDMKMQLEKKLYEMKAAVQNLAQKFEDDEKLVESGFKYEYRPEDDVLKPVPLSSIIPPDENELVAYVDDYVDNVMDEVVEEERKSISSARSQQLGEGNQENQPDVPETVEENDEEPLVDPEQVEEKRQSVLQANTSSTSQRKSVLQANTSSTSQRKSVLEPKASSTSATSQRKSILEPKASSQSRTSDAPPKRPSTLPPLKKNKSKEDILPEIAEINTKSEEEVAEIHAPAELPECKDPKSKHRHHHHHRSNSPNSPVYIVAPVSPVMMAQQMYPTRKHRHHSHSHGAKKDKRSTVESSRPTSEPSEMDQQQAVYYQQPQPVFYYTYPNQAVQAAAPNQVVFAQPAMPEQYMMQPQVPYGYTYAYTAGKPDSVTTGETETDI